MRRPGWLSLASLREVGPIAVLSVLALGLLGFAALAELVGDEKPNVLDRSILTALRLPNDPSTPIGPVWLHYAMADITALGGFTILTLLTVGAAVYRSVLKDYATAL